MINGFFIKEKPKRLIQHYSTSKLHKCVKYDLITTNYAMLNAIPQLNLSRNPYYIHEYYDDIHGIVWLNKSILYTSVHLGMENNVAEKSFHFRYTKNHFSFSECRKRLFCEATTKDMLQIWTTIIYKNIRPYLMHK